MANYKRFYILHFGYLYSLSYDGYVQFLKDAAKGGPDGWDLENTQYEARVVKREPHGKSVFRVTDREPEEFKEELKYFLQHQDVAPWSKFTRTV